MSTCIGKCKLVNDVCSGCGRHIDDIVLAGIKQLSRSLFRPPVRKPDADGNKRAIKHILPVMDPPGPEAKA